VLCGVFLLAQDAVTHSRMSLPDAVAEEDNIDKEAFVCLNDFII
jgi:hypothetical protein